MSKAQTQNLPLGIAASYIYRTELRTRRTELWVRQSEIFNPLIAKAYFSVNSILSPELQQLLPGNIQPTNWYVQQAYFVYISFPLLCVHYVSLMLCIPTLRFLTLLFLKQVTKHFDTWRRIVRRRHSITLYLAPHRLYLHLLQP